MNYLITGGAGFIGSHLSDALVARGDSVGVLDNFTTGSKENLSGLILFCSVCSNARNSLAQSSRQEMTDAYATQLKAGRSIFATTPF